MKTEARRPSTACHACRVAATPHAVGLAAPGLDGERRGPGRHGARRDVDDRQRGRLPRRGGEARTRSAVSSAACSSPATCSRSSPAATSATATGTARSSSVSLLWAGVATMLTGVRQADSSLFIVVRVVTGLGEGAFYSNDRSLITATTPERERSLAMGVVITGLSLGITVAIVFTPELVALAARSSSPASRRGGCCSWCSAPPPWSSA